MQRLRVGLVGGGPWARNVHAPGLAAHSGVELAGVWARRREVAAEIAALHGGEPHAAFAALLDDVDAVAFAVPPDVQAALATQAAAAGKHVILDKPVAATVEQAEQLAAAIEAADVASIIMLTLRFAPETREWLDELALVGGWSGGGARWLSGALLGGDYAGSPWRHESGALADVGPHAFDILDAALGEVVDVVAARYREPDLWTVILAHAGGAVSTADLSMKLPLLPSIVGVDVYGTSGHRHLEPRQTTPQECYTTLLDELLGMVHAGTHVHPCDARRGLHLQRIIEHAANLAG